MKRLDRFCAEVQDARRRARLGVYRSLMGRHAGYALELLLRHWPRVDVFGDPDEGDFSVDRTGVRTSQATLFG